MSDPVPTLHPSRFSSEEWRLVKLLADVGGTWPWYMTDDEYRTVKKAIDRVKAEVGGGRDE